MKGSLFPHGLVTVARLCPYSRIRPFIRQYLIEFSKSTDRKDMLDTGKACVHTPDRRTRSGLSVLRMALALCVDEKVKPKTALDMDLVTHRSKFV